MIVRARAFIRAIIGPDGPGVGHIVRNVVTLKGRLQPFRPRKKLYLTNTVRANMVWLNQTQPPQEKSRVNESTKNGTKSLEKISK